MAELETSEVRNPWTNWDKMWHEWLITTATSRYALCSKRSLW